jgi:hypothetical protein
MRRIRYWFVTVAFKGLVLAITGVACGALWIVFPFSIVALMALFLFILSTIALIKV